MTPVRLQAPFYPRGEHFAIDLPGSQALFTTRRGGVSQGPYASLNLGLLTDDDAGAVEQNRRTLEAELDAPLCFVRQVHGSTVHALGPAGAGPARPAGSGALTEADGQITVAPGVAPAVLTADCLPVVVGGPGGVAVLHAGWRGLEAGILSAGVAALRDAGVHGALTAAIGPGAQACCYEVGPEVHRAFAGYPETVHQAANLDLPAIAREQLQRCGVHAVHDIGLCTICSQPTLLFSHRRDHGLTGRQAGLAWLT